MNEYIKQCYKCKRMIYSIFYYTNNGRPICSNCLNDLIDKCEKENKRMEDEILDKLEEIYNNYISIVINTLKANVFEIVGTLRITKGEIIRLSFIFEYTYIKEMTLDYNVFNIKKEIDKHIVKLFKEE